MLSRRFRILFWKCQPVIPTIFSEFLRKMTQILMGFFSDSSGCLEMVSREKESNHRVDSGRRPLDLDDIRVEENCSAADHSTSTFARWGAILSLCRVRSYPTASRWTRSGKTRGSWRYLITAIINVVRFKQLLLKSSESGSFSRLLISFDFIIDFLKTNDKYYTEFLSQCQSNQVKQINSLYIYIQQYQRWWFFKLGSALRNAANDLLLEAGAADSSWDGRLSPILVLAVTDTW